MKTVSTIAGIVLLALSAANQAMADTIKYPTRPVKILVGYVPGGGSDATARMAANILSEAFGQPFVVENRPGAGGNIAGDVAAKAKPDGYTLLIAPSSLATNPSTYPSMPFNPLTDLAPIVKVSVVPKNITIHPSIPAQNIKELAAYAKANPDKVSCASAAAGSIGHMSCELFNKRTGTKMVHVAYKGSAAATRDTIAGQVQVLFDDVTTTLPHIRSGALRAIAVLGKTRNAHLPDVPTADESGLPGFFAETWVALLAPAGTPKEILAAINKAMNVGLAKAEVRKRLAAVGMEAAGGSQEEMVQLLAEDTAKWSKVAEDAGLKPKAK